MQQGLGGGGAGARAPPRPPPAEAKPKKFGFLTPILTKNGQYLQECLLVTSGIVTAIKLSNQLFDKNCAMMFTYNV